MSLATFVVARLIFIGHIFHSYGYPLPDNPHVMLAYQPVGLVYANMRNPLHFISSKLHRRYPAMGFHTRGEMGGIWFGINGQWIGPATSFTSGFGYAQMALPSTNGVQVTRTDFAPDGRRAVDFGLTLTASNSAPFTLNVDA